MNVSVRIGGGEIRGVTRALLDRMLSPFCGIDQEIGFVMRSRGEPRVVTAGAELTGVHLLNGREEPARGAYHIGGCGATLDEALIRSLGESVERYSQLLPPCEGFHDLVFSTRAEMVSAGRTPLAAERLRLFSDAQLARPGNPFQGFDDAQPLTWLRARSLVGAHELWVPAQFLLVGYTPRRSDGEPWLQSAVTTGTAAHVDPVLALLSALLELIQLDAAMGHWYSAASAPRIMPGERTAAVDRVVARLTPPGCPRPAFHWLRNPDLPGFSIACVFENRAGALPRFGVGLGADTALGPAMYKAFLEAVGVVSLARFVLLRDAFTPAGASAQPDSGRMLDLEQNVGYYARGAAASRMREKFPADHTVPASALPRDMEGSAGERVRALVHSFRDTAKELIFLDLTSGEARALGFTVVRVWSPDTLSLAIPSAPPVLHPRFEAYQGVAHEDPHPYP